MNWSIMLLKIIIKETKAIRRYQGLGERQTQGNKSDKMQWWKENKITSSKLVFAGEKMREH